MNAAVMVSLFEISSDGRTAHERTRGKKYRRELPIFGECVFYLPMDRARGRLNKLEAKWLSGVYLGLKLSTNELYIGTENWRRENGGSEKKTRNESMRLGRGECGGWFAEEAYTDRSA